MTVLDGKKIARDIRMRLKKDIQRSGITPGLVAILVGDDPASHIYVGLKEKAAKEVGVHFERIELPDDTGQEEIVNTIYNLNNRDDVHGILVQLPLPKHLNTDKIIRAIHPDKDADGFHPENIKLIHEGNTKIISPPHAGIIDFLEKTDINLEGKKATVLANSYEFSNPLVDLLTMRGVEVANLVKKEKYQAYTQQADIIIIAVGKAQMLQEKDIKKNAIIIDVGTNKVNGKIVGDVDFESVKNKASFITPVPGGVGPMTVAYLLKNTFELAIRIISQQK